MLPSLTGKGVAVGTPYYMAPEQMRREALDGRADQFSWGVVAYELLTGSPTWGRDVDALELVSKLLSEDPTPIAEVCPELPPHVGAAVMRAISKRKGARYATMEEIVAVLEDAGGAFAPTLPRIMVSEPVAAEIAPAPAPPSRLATTASVRPPKRRGPRVALLAGAVAAVAAVAAIAIVAASRRTATTAPMASASASAAAPECAHNAECVTKLGGKPAVCNARGACAAIESEDCKALYEPGDLTRDDTTFWVGAMFPTTGPAKGRRLRRRGRRTLSISGVGTSPARRSRGPRAP